MYRPTLLLFLLTTFLGCDDGNSSHCVCTEEFRSITVTVVDDSSNPVEGMAVTIRIERTGRLLTPIPVFGEQGLDGIYTIITDSELDELESDGDLISFSATGVGISASTQFVIGTTDCRCHVTKISGPETITAN